MFNLFAILLAVNVDRVVKVNRVEHLGRVAWVLFVSVADKLDTNSLITLNNHLDVIFGVVSLFVKWSHNLRVVPLFLGSSRYL